jgi:hypothetical protein
MADRVYAWRQVAVVLASSDSARLLRSLGINRVEDRVRAWARGLLDPVEDLYEVYANDPDGGVAAARIEAELAALVPTAVFDELREGAILFARPIDDDLDDWSKVFSTLPFQDDPAVPVPGRPLRDDLRSLVLAHLERALPSGPVPVLAEEQAEDAWVVAFAERHGRWPFEQAYGWAELRRTLRAVRELDATLGPSDREALEAWAQAERDSGSRPSDWRAAPRMRLADAAVRGWHHMTSATAD